ncbi:MAG: hypothetical protein EXR92_02975 [Gemmatimonadetes bacterium]|nr:hypothetical protein [Gemmatimonadota bacterium]
MESEHGVSPSAPAQGAGSRVQARVALALLLTVREYDRPGEVLDDEDLTLTLPRRFGLSEVVDSQIRRYEQDVRRLRRIPESEVRDLIRLVTRRPDSEELFRQVGRSLRSAGASSGWRRLLPRGAAYALARRAVVRRLRALFGQPVITTVSAPFRLEAPTNLLLEGDPGGEVCAVVTGLSQAILEGSMDAPGEVHHPRCRAHGHDLCVWDVRESSALPPSSAVPVSTEEAHG